MLKHATWIPFCMTIIFHLRSLVKRIKIVELERLHFCLESSSELVYKQQTTEEVTGWKHLLNCHLKSVVLKPRRWAFSIINKSVQLSIFAKQREFLLNTWIQKMVHIANLFLFCLPEISFEYILLGVTLEPCKWVQLLLLRMQNCEAAQKIIIIHS